MPRKLPIRSAVREVYQRLLRGFGYAAMIAGIWIAISLFLPLSAIFLAGGGDSLKGATIIVFAAGWLTLPVLWHHHQLRPDAPHLTVRQCLYRSAFYGWQLFFICSLASLVYMPTLMVGAFANVELERFLESFPQHKLDESILLNATLAAVALAFTWVFVRLCLALPAAALAVPDFSTWASWKHTRGHGLRLLSAWILTILPPAAPIASYIYFEFEGAVKGLDSDVVPFVILAVTLCLLSLVLLSTLSLISVAYAFLVENKPIAPPTHSEMTGVVIRSRRALSAPPPTRP